MMLLYATFDEVNQISQKIWERADVSALSAGLIGLAAAFILFNWYRMFAGNALKNKPLDMQVIIEGILYMGLVGAAGTILTYADNLMVEFGDAIVGMTANDIPEGIWDNYNETYDHWSDYANPASWIYELLRMLIMAFVIVIDYAFFLTRGFLIFFLKLTFPLVLALGAIKENRSLVWKFIRTYLAVYLTGYGYIIAIGFTNAAFIALQENAVLSDQFPIIPLLVVLTAKKLMYSKVDALSSNIL